MTFCLSFVVLTDSDDNLNGRLYVGNEGVDEEIVRYRNCIVSSEPWVVRISDGNPILTGAISSGLKLWTSYLLWPIASWLACNIYI